MIKIKPKALVGHPHKSNFVPHPKMFLGFLSRIGDDESHHLDHEHRKHRHEEDDDECPEEIKFM